MLLESMHPRGHKMQSKQVKSGREEGFCNTPKVEILSLNIFISMTTPIHIVHNNLVLKCVLPIYYDARYV